MLVSLDRFDYCPINYPKLNNFSGNLFSSSETNLDGFTDIEIVIDQEEYSDNKPTKKVKPDLLHSSKNEKDSFNIAVLSNESLRAPLLLKNIINLNKKNPTMRNSKQVPISINAFDNLNQCLDLLGKRKNPVFQDENCSQKNKSVEQGKLTLKEDEKCEINYDSETTAEEEITERGSLVPVGSNYQADIPTSKGASSRRTPKSVWNPEIINRSTLNEYFDKMHKTISQNITNHEKAVKLLQAHDMKVEGLLGDMKANKLYYRGLFSLNQRARRDKTLQKCYS